MLEMPVVAEKVLNLMDKIVQMEDDGPVLSLLAEIRDCLGGATPSMILQRVVIGAPDAACELRYLQVKYDELFAKSAPKQPTADEKGELYYTIGEFMAALQIKMGRTYGWRVDYVAASAKASGCTQAKNENIQKWQRTKKVPAWAYDQIAQLSFEKRLGQGGPLWTTQDTDYLVSLYLANPNISNGELASLCTQHFGRPITESAVRGQLDRQRKKGRIDKYRPKKNE